MIRLELLREKDSEIIPVGLSKFVFDDVLMLADLDSRPKITNPFGIYFGSYSGKKVTATHLGLFPEVGDRGVVMLLTRAIPLRKGDYVTFIAGSVSMDMILCSTNTRTIRR